MTGARSMTHRKTSSPARAICRRVWSWKPGCPYIADSDYGGLIGVDADGDQWRSWLDARRDYLFDRDHWLMVGAPKADARRQARQTIADLGYRPPKPQSARCGGLRMLTQRVGCPSATTSPDKLPAGYPRDPSHSLETPVSSPRTCSSHCSTTSASRDQRHRSAPTIADTGPYALRWCVAGQWGVGGLGWGFGGPRAVVRRLEYSSPD